MSLAHDTHSPWALSWESSDEKSRLHKCLVITTHRHDDFECPSPRNYVDTESWLAYEQNPYLIHWVRSGSCHTKTSIGYDILSAITRLRANTNIRLLHTATTFRCFELRGYVTLPQLVQPWVAAPSPAWLSNTIASMTQQHRHQHDSACTLHCGQVALTASSPAWLSSTVISMTQHLHHTIAKWPW
jgi:hypothetical protein